MAKSLTQLVPDFREALEEGVQQATETVVRDLQVAGPYWTGFFSQTCGRSTLEQGGQGQHQEPT